MISRLKKYIRRKKPEPIVTTETEAVDKKVDECIGTALQAVSEASKKRRESSPGMRKVLESAEHLTQKLQLHSIKP